MTVDGLYWDEAGRADVGMIEPGDTVYCICRGADGLFSVSSGVCVDPPVRFIDFGDGVVKPLINLLAASYAKGGYDAGCALECFRAAAAEIKGGASAEDACALMRRYLPELAEDCQLEAEIARATEGLR